MSFASPARRCRRPSCAVISIVASVLLLDGGEVARAASKVDAKTDGEVEPRGKLLDGVVNLNTATPAVLLMLPGVGPGRVRGILDYRARRPFRTVDELVRIKGIGRRMVREIRPHLAVTGPSTARAGPPGLAGLNALAARPLAAAPTAPIASAKASPRVVKPQIGGPAGRALGRGGTPNRALRALRARANHCPGPA